MRVRTLTGNTYYMRSGAKIVGKVHEKFMLIDGIRVTTGSYRQVLGSAGPDEAKGEFLQEGCINFAVCLVFMNANGTGTS